MTARPAPAPRPAPPPSLVRVLAAALRACPGVIRDVRERAS